ncbi:glycosyl hydrolase [Catenovulum agarivorans]|uniref:glycosyl hydrolase n=1 Tax=Catenovulum agarivorans TaxID=1172192 RepID=UPI0012FB5808|nr:glycosyl hydrolase [Catenovulum agarivorans]
MTKNTSLTTGVLLCLSVAIGTYGCSSSTNTVESTKVDKTTAAGNTSEQSNDNNQYKYAKNVVGANQLLINKDANAITHKVYQYLLDNFGSKVLAGQQDLTWQDNIDMYARVLADTGKAPAIMGYDFMNYDRYQYGSGLQQTEEAIAHWQRGGLVTFAWHWRDPSLKTQEFYTEKSDFVIPMKEQQLDTQSDDFKAIVRDIDIIAAELKKLQQAGVPVLWRPMHEAADNQWGGWFWWGANRTDGEQPNVAFIKLWQFMFHYLTEDHGLNNLIWVWNGLQGSWYPGDEYVDVIGDDIYATPHDYGSQVERFQLVKSFSAKPKPVALTENGVLPDPNKMANEQAMWGYFVTWNDIDTAAGVTDKGNFWTGEYHSSNAHKKYVYNHELVITLDELPKFTE